MNISEDIVEEEPRPVERGDVVAGRYRIERQIASGGMGVVFAARHVTLDHLIAVKFMQPNLARNSEAVVRFLNEAKAVAKLRNEHLVRVIDVGRHTNGLPFMVLEYLKGIDLADIMARQQPSPIDVAAAYILQACEGLADAHAHGIVHRDLKPENLFLTEAADGEALLKVLDFGISKQLHGPRARSLTNPSRRLGSPDYMAPEAMRNPNEVDQRADIWALGVVLYELLTGRLPFGGDSVPAVCAKVLSHEPPPLRSFRAEVSRELESAVLKCLEKHPKDRYASVAHLATALAPFATSGEDAARRVARVLWSERGSAGRSHLVVSKSAGLSAARPRTLSNWSFKKRPFVAFMAGATAGAGLALWWSTETEASSLRAAIAMAAAPLLGFGGSVPHEQETDGAQCSDPRSALPVDRWIPKALHVPLESSAKHAAQQAQDTTASLNGGGVRPRNTRRE